MHKSIEAKLHITGKWYISKLVMSPSHKIVVQMATWNLRGWQFYLAHVVVSDFGDVTFDDITFNCMACKRNWVYLEQNLIV